MTGVFGVTRPSSDTATTPLGTSPNRFGNSSPRSAKGAEGRRRRDEAAAEPRVERARELWVAHAERRVGDPTAPRQQVEGELDRLEVRVARDPPEVRGALARRLLDALDEGARSSS